MSGLQIWRPDGSVLFDSASRPGRVTGSATHNGPAVVIQTIAVPTGPGKSPWMAVFPWGGVTGSATNNGNGTWTYNLTVPGGATAIVYWGER